MPSTIANSNIDLRSLRSRNTLKKRVKHLQCKVYFLLLLWRLPHNADMVWHSREMCISINQAPTSKRLARNRILSKDDRNKNTQRHIYVCMYIHHRYSNRAWNRFMISRWSYNIFFIHAKNTSNLKCIQIVVCLSAQFAYIIECSYICT